MQLTIDIGNSSLKAALFPSIADPMKEGSDKEYTLKYDYKKEMSREEENSKNWQFIRGFVDWFK